MVKVQCHVCKYKWDYKGLRERTCCCPTCGCGSVRVNRTDAELKILAELKEEMSKQKEDANT